MVLVEEHIRDITNASRKYKYLSRLTTKDSYYQMQTKQSYNRGEVSKKKTGEQPNERRQIWITFSLNVIIDPV